MDSQGKKNLFFIFIIALLLYGIVSAIFDGDVAAQTTCENTLIKSVLRNLIYNYLSYDETFQGTNITLAKIKGLLILYKANVQLASFACPNYLTFVTEAGNLSLRPPKCSDGTYYGECSSTKPMYCYGYEGTLVPRCKICGCPSGQLCDETYTYTEKNNLGQWGKCYSETNFTCSIDSDCGISGYVGDYYCQNGDVYKNYISYTCISGNATSADTCVSKTTAKLIEDCGTSGYVGNYYCQNGDVYKNYISYTCLSPGGSNVTCASETTAKLIDDCQLGEKCVGGESSCQSLGRKGWVKETTFTGGADNEWFGYSVASGDVNNDGYADVILGDYKAAPYDEGKVYVFFGTADGISNMTTSSANITYNSITSGTCCSDQFGYDVASGDVNNDGYDDVIVGATYAFNAPYASGGTISGVTYVFFGANYPSLTSISASNANIKINGLEQHNQIGYSVATGDVNGDNYDDIIVGSVLNPYESGEWSGRAYVIFGAASGFTRSVSDADMTFKGSVHGEYLGSQVASGDVNNDGYDDVIARGGKSQAKKVYIFYGGDYNTPVNEVAATYANITIDGLTSTLASCDINNDAYSDIILADVTGAWVAAVFGDDYTSPINISNYNIIVTGFGNWQGAGALSCGDVNNDNYNDIIAGAYSYNSNTGRAYVFFGSAAGFSKTTSNADIAIESETSNSYFGWAVSGGDVNNDGYSEIIVGAYKENKAYIYTYDLKCLDVTEYGKCSPVKPRYCDKGEVIDNCQICGCKTGYGCQVNGTCQQICSDGTFYEECSVTKPKYCDNGTLIDNIQVCGCLDGTPYHQCSTTKPKYCDIGGLINNCQTCGCPEKSNCKNDNTCSGIN